MNYPKAGHKSPLRSCGAEQLAATGRHKHTQVTFLWITLRFRTIAAFPINSARLDIRVFTSGHVNRRLDAGIEHAQLTFFRTQALFSKT